MPVSVLLTSALTGAGKNFMADALKWMVGEEEHAESVTSDSLKGGCQSFVPGTSLVVVSELYEGGNYGFADELKTLQSEDMLFVNMNMGHRERAEHDALSRIFEQHGANQTCDENDRRWFTFASPQREVMPADWWEDKIPEPEEPKGRPAALGRIGKPRRWFDDRMVDIERTGRFKPHGRPLVTEHKQAIVEDSRSGLYGRLKEMLADGEASG